MNRCLISWSLCDNPENSFGRRKAPHCTWQIWISPFTSCPYWTQRHRHFVWLWPGQCLLWLVSSLLMLVETWAGLTIGMDGHGSCPACVSIPQSPIGGPNKGVHYTPLGFRGQCQLRGLWLLTCHITNTILIFRAAGRIIWTWRLWNGRLLCRWAWLFFVLWLLWCVIFIPVAVRIHYNFSYFISRQHTKHHHVAFSTKLQHS